MVVALTCLAGDHQDPDAVHSTVVRTGELLRRSIVGMHTHGVVTEEEAERMKSVASALQTMAAALRECAEDVSDRALRMGV